MVLNEVLSITAQESVPKRDRGLRRLVLNEVLSITAQESIDGQFPARLHILLNEVLSITAQELRIILFTAQFQHSSMKS